MTLFDTWLRRSPAALAVTLVTALAAGTGCSTIKQRLPLQNTAQTEAKPKGSFESSLSLARLSERHGQIENARQVYEAVLRNDPDNAFAHHRLGVIAARQRQLPKAEEHFQKALSQDGSNAQLLADLGYLFYLQDRLPEAEEKLRQALELDPSIRTARTNLGLVVGEQGRVDESFAEFSRAGAEAEAHCNQAYVFAMLGDMERAEKHYHTALSLNRELRPAAEALAQLSERRRALAPRDRQSGQSEIALASFNAPTSDDGFLSTVGEIPRQRSMASQPRNYAPPMPAPAEFQQAFPPPSPTNPPPPSNPSAIGPTETAGVQPAPLANAGATVGNIVPAMPSAWSQPTWTADASVPGSLQH